MYIFAQIGAIVTGCNINKILINYLGDLGNQNRNDITIGTQAGLETG